MTQIAATTFFGTGRVGRRAHDSRKYIAEKVYAKGVWAFSASGAFDANLSRPGVHAARPARRLRIRRDGDSA